MLTLSTCLNRYALSEQMMIPFRRDQLEKKKTPAMEKYQSVLTGARSCVEQVNAQLKGRWRYVPKKYPVKKIL